MVMLRCFVLMCCVLTCCALVSAGCSSQVQNNPATTPAPTADVLVTADLSNAPDLSQTPAPPAPLAPVGWPLLIKLLTATPNAALVFSDTLFCGLRQVRPPLSGATGGHADTLPQVIVSGYAIRDGDRSCGGFPSLLLKTPQGMCVGLVASDAVGWLKPRTLTQIADGRWLVADMGSWSKPRGAVWLREHDGTWRKILDKLGPLHGLALGPDGLVYIGERSKIVRFDPLAKDPTATLEDVIVDLPSEGRHPLKHFVFGLDRDLFINIGSASDHCEEDKKQPAGNQLCPEVEGPEPYASVRHYTLDGPKNTASKWTTFGRGLRNSMALAVHPTSGLLIQAENARDFKPEDRPFEELNILKGGDAHYGWPYCHGMGETSPEWAKWSEMDCKGEQYVKPALLMPAHTAPLGMLYYTGEMFESLRGKLIVSWHGYRSNGHRIVAYDVDADGVPLQEPAPVDGNPMGYYTTLVDAWGASPGLHPQGNPVGLAVAQDGAIWTVEDKNKTVLRIGRPTPWLNDSLPLRFASCADLPTFAPPINMADPSTWTTTQLAAALADATTKPAQQATAAAFAELYQRVIVPNCSNCHAYHPTDPNISAAVWIQQRLILPGNPDESDFYIRLTSAHSPGRMPPTPAPMLSALQTGIVRAWIERLDLR